MYSIEDFGSLRIKLGDAQKYIRGDVSLPIGGGPDILAAIHTQSHGKRLYKATARESYIVLARFPSNGLPHLETIHAYGSSANPDSPHYTDQMDLFVNQKLKPISLDTAKVISEAKSIYHPMTLVEN